MPLYPTVSYSRIAVGVMAPRTFLLVVPKGDTLTYDDTHFEDRFWFDHAGNFPSVDGLAVFSTKNLIFAELDETISWAIFTVSVNDIVKGLKFPKIS